MRSRRKSEPRLSESMEIVLGGLDLSLPLLSTTPSPERFTLLPMALSGGNARAGVSSLRLLGRRAQDAEE